jgi:segregation and condensation protein A
MTPLGELTIRWTGTDDGEIEVSDEFDELVDPDAEARDLDAPDEAEASDLGADEAEASDLGTQDEAEVSDLGEPDEAEASDLGAPDEEPDPADLAGEDDEQPRYDADAVGAAGTDTTPGPNEMVADQ